MKFIKQYIEYLIEMSMTKRELESSNTYISTVKQKSSLANVKLGLENRENRIKTYRILDTKLRFYIKENDNKINFSPGLSDFSEETISEIILTICNELKINNLKFILRDINEKKVYLLLMTKDKNFKLMNGEIFYTNPVYNFYDKSQIKLNKMFSNILLDDIKTEVTQYEDFATVDFSFTKGIDEYLIWLKKRGYTGLLRDDKNHVFMVFTNDNNQISTSDINPNLRNVGFGYKLYKKLIEEVKFISSTKGLSSPYAKKVWYSLLQDKDYYHILNKTEVVVIYKKISDEELLSIYNKFKDFENFDEELLKRIKQTFK